MGYMFCTAACINCKRLFTFNPNTVPSVNVNGSRQPICRPCVEWANPQRVAKGLEPIRVLPGAYEAQECA
jgi:hypothetical protein